jgi:hypothetical protein
MDDNENNFVEISREDYHKTPDNFPRVRIVRNSSNCKTDDTMAYPCYDDNNLYLPLGMYSGSNIKGNIAYYMEINKHCIMDALAYWKTIKEPEDDDIQYFRHTAIIEAANIRFDNMIVNGILALNNREYKEEEISDDE